MTAAGLVAMHGARLHGEDAAWLHMDDATNPMIVSGLLELDGELTSARAEELLRRLNAFVPFAARVVEPVLHVRTPRWEPVEVFDVAAHLERVHLETGSDAELRAFVGRVLSAHLDPSRPLWRVYLIDRPGHGTAVLFRAHHAMADGYALLGVLNALADTSMELPVRRRPPPVVPFWEAARRLAKAAERLLRLSRDAPTTLQGQLGGTKLVAWSEPVSLATIKRIGVAARATVNDVIAAAVAGALRRYFERRAEPCDALEIRGMVPVDLRKNDSDLEVTNRFGLVILGLPVGIVDPIARIGAIHRRMTLLKDSAEAEVARLLLSVLGYTPRVLEDAVVRYFGRKASLVFTNLIGPREHARLAGIPIARMKFWVPEAAHLGLGISAFSYAGEVTVCALADAAIVSDPQLLMTDFQAELACALEAAETLERAERAA